MAQRYGINPKTVAKWKKRGTVTDLPAGPKDAKDYVYFLKRADSPEVYRLNGYYFEDLNVTNDKFVKGPAEEKENAAS